MALMFDHDEKIVYCDELKKKKEKKKINLYRTLTNQCRSCI